MSLVTGFTLVEVLVVMTLLSLIVLSLMMVLNSTQTAFRAGIAQTGVLESGRAVTDLIKSDLETMTPSFGISNSAVGAANFYAAVTNYPSPPSPLFQSLVGSSGGQMRTNVLENFFILSRGNMSGSDNWIGTGYAVYVSPTNLYSLYRFSTNHPVMTTDPAFIFTNDFYRFLLAPTNGSHLMDGVVELRVRAYDPNGMWMNDIYTNVLNFSTNSTMWGETGFYMFSYTVPASVEVELGVLEDSTLQRAESLSGSAQTNYLAQHAGQVHVFRQRAWIRNVDPSAYQ
ncbi:MAG: type II secretion system protein J [Limisphaerales bacterium]